MCCGDSGGGTQTTVQSNDPWSGQQPYLQTGFGRAESDVLNRPLEFFPESTVVPFAPESQRAMELTAQRAQQGSPLIGAGADTLGATIRGDFLDAGNPYFSGMMDRIAGEVRPRIDAQFTSAGRYGSGMHAGTTAKALSDAASDLAFRNYSAERGMQQQALGLAPRYAAQDYLDFSMLGQVGGQREGKAQENLADSMARWDFAQREPSQRIGDFMGLIGGGYGGQSTTTTRQSGGDPLLGLLGAGASIAGMGGPTGFGWW